MKKGQFGNILKITFIAMVLASFVFADQDETQMTWVTPSSYAHTIAYGGSCDTSNFFFVVNYTQNGRTWGSGCSGVGAYSCENATIPKSTNAGANYCQWDTWSAMNISNTGNQDANITVQMNVTGGTQANITLKAQHNVGGTAGCGANGNASYDVGACANDPGGPPADAACISVTATEKTLVYDLNASGASGDSQGICWFSDFEGIIWPGAASQNDTNVSTYAKQDGT